MQWKYGMQKEESFVKIMQSEDLSQSKAQAIICGVIESKSPAETNHTV